MPPCECQSFSRSEACARGARPTGSSPAASCSWTGSLWRSSGARALRTQHLALAPQAQRQQASRLTVLLHKPVGYVSHADDEGRPKLPPDLITPDRRWQGPQGHRARGERERERGRGQRGWGAL